MLEQLLVAVLAAGAGYLFARLRVGSHDAPPPPVEEAPPGHVLGRMRGEAAELGVDYLLRSVPVTGESVQIHLAVASLARDRGESDDAIRIHRHLLANDAFASDEQRRARVQMELVRDFLAAGLLDRAEAILQELVEGGQAPELHAEEHLLEVYQRERDWRKAADLARRLVAEGHAHLSGYLAHYLCELAVERGATMAGEGTSGVELYEEALSVDPSCVRALLALGKLALDAGDCERALAHYEAVIEHDPRFLSEALGGLEAVHRKRGTLAAWVERLAELHAEQGSAAVVLQRARALRALARSGEAKALLRAELATHPSAALLAELIELESEQGSLEHGDPLRVYAQGVPVLGALYRCAECGFSAHELMWSCPSCQRWNSILPVEPDETR